MVAELLKEKYPQAELWRLTNQARTTYDHVFVCIDGKSCDIHGFRSVDEMLFDLDAKGLVEEVVSAQADIPGMSWLPEPRHLAET